MTAPDPPTIGDLLRDAAARLKEAGIEAPRREARLLLAAALDLPNAASLPNAATPSNFSTRFADHTSTRFAEHTSTRFAEHTSTRFAEHTSTRFAEHTSTRFAAMLARREAREPLALITGRQGFWTLDLAVSPATLIPRADSETLMETALATFPDRARVKRILDLGTGTGALLLAALSEFPQAFGVGTDRSEDACRLAAANAATAGLAARTAILRADWSAPLAGRFDLVLANPPYIETAVLAGLMPEVREYEPASALDGGADGLAAYRAILPALPELLNNAGIAVIEIGQGQAPAVAQLATQHGIASGDPRRDLSGIERALPLWRHAVRP